MSDLPNTSHETGVKVPSDNPNVLLALKEDLCSAHNHNLTKVNFSHVYHFYSNGEITMQKSGVGVYGWRSIFIRHHSVFNKGLFDLPMKDEEMSYAIITGDDADAFKRRLDAIMSDEATFEKALVDMSSKK